MACAAKIYEGPGRWLLTTAVLSLAVTLSGCSEDTDPANRPVTETRQTRPQPPLPPSPPDKRAIPTVSGEDLREAASLGKIETVRRAISLGTEVDALDADDRTALLLAAFDGHTETVQLLLENKADVNHRDAMGRTALIYAASGPNPETVQLLLEAGADPDIADKAEGFTALMFAAAEGQFEVVKALVKYGADKNLRDIDGDTARSFATTNGHLEIARLLGNK